MKTPRSFATILRSTTWLTLVAVLGCQAIAGIEKAEYDPSLDTTSTQSGDGDSSSGDGDGDTPPTTAGDGDGDTPTTEGDGDGDGDTDPVPVPGVAGAHFSPDSCANDVAVNADDLIACLYRVSCDPEVTPTFSLTNCVTFDYLHAAASEVCSSTATSCDEVYECIHRKPASSDELSLCEGATWAYGDVCTGRCTGACDGLCDGAAPYDSYNYCDGACDGACYGSCDSSGAKKWACDGSYAVNCLDGGPAYDCAGVNAECGEAYATSSSPDGSCFPASPSEAAIADCQGETETTSRCDGNLLYWCANDMVWGIECEQACVDGINGSYCSLTSETCSDPGTSSCSGESIDFCNDDGMLFVHECDRNGLTCDDSTADCVADGCSSSGCTERCVDEHVVEFCVGGAQIQLDCTEYGFAGCVEQSDGDYGLARCTFGLEVAPAE